MSAFVISLSLFLSPQRASAVHSRRLELKVPFSGSVLLGRLQPIRAQWLWNWVVRLIGSEAIDAAVVSRKAFLKAASSVLPRLPFKVKQSYFLS